MFCMECGTKLPDGAKFCMNCGTKVGQTAKAAPASVPMTPCGGTTVCCVLGKRYEMGNKELTEEYWNTTELGKREKIYTPYLGEVYSGGVRFFEYTVLDDGTAVGLLEAEHPDKYSHLPCLNENYLYTVAPDGKVTYQCNIPYSATCNDRYVLDGFYYCTSNQGGKFRKNLFDGKTSKELLNPGYLKK